MERYGDKIVGWKAAFTNDAAMEKMKTPEPRDGAFVRVLGLPQR